MPGAKTQERVLVVAPVGHDAGAMAAVLAERGFSVQVCDGNESACQGVLEAGVLLMTDDAFELAGVGNLLETLKGQPSWSELPLIILTKGGEPRFEKLLDLAASAAGSVTLLERPLGTATLVRSVEVALRSRRRQYQVRDLLAEGRRREQELQTAKARLEAELAERKRAQAAVERLAAIVESSEDAIISKDVEERITSWNRSAEKLYGYSAAEAIGQPITLILPPDRLDEEPAIMARLRRREVVEHYETVRRRKNGTLVDIALTVSPIKDAQGNIVGASKITRDITETKRAQRELAESEERYRTLVEQVKDYAIFRMDHQGRPTSWNEGVRRVLGFREREFLGRDISNIFTPEDVEAGVPERELRKAAETGTANNDRWMRRADGTRFFATGVTTALRNEAGELVGYTKVLRDNTELAEAQAKLAAYALDLERLVAERTKDLRATNEQLEDFVYSIAHDLRTPLRTVTGYSQLLLEEYGPQLEDTVQNLLRRIFNATEFMDKLLLDLLAFGRAARAQIELTPVEVQKAWETARFQCASQLEQTQAEVDTVEPLPTVLAHEATLGQCLANLLGNSLKFVSPGVRPRIRFRAEENGGMARLWLEDNGIGIAPEYRQRIFRVFERLHGSRYPGTGIGLSIVRKGVERMGGQVGVESEPGKGSRFWIQLANAG